MKCKKLVRDVGNLGALMMSLADGLAVKGAMFGPDGDMMYDWECYRPVKYGPGPCGSYKIKRTPRTDKAKALGLKEEAHVGNLYGLNRQLSRDIARLHGCSRTSQIGKETGFEGVRRRRNRRAR
jgi:hypothetical protein